MPDPGAQRSGGMGGRGGGRSDDDVREAARTVAAIASARAAPRGALERLGAQRASAAQSGPRGALERVAAKRAAVVRAPTVRADVSRPAPTVFERVVGSPSKPARLYGPEGHFANQQVIENQANLGIISGSFADRLKGLDIARQGLNPMIGLFGALPYQAITNTIDQYDPNDPYGSMWGGITSGVGQGINNMRGILSAYGMGKNETPYPGLLGYIPNL